MFVGHVALAFAAKRAHPTVSLGWFAAAVTAADLIWPVFVLAGVEHVQVTPGPGATAFTPLTFTSYPWSHSIITLLGWGTALAAVARWHGLPRGAARLLIPLVLSHWVLDYITHAPDMPLWPGDSPRVGLGLWNSIPGTFVVEGAMWTAAIALYLRAARPASAAGRVAFWSFVAVATTMWAAGPWGPPPESERALGLFALIGWLVVPWLAYADAQMTQGKRSAQPR